MIGEGIRRYTSKDYPLISKWYVKHGMSPPKQECLSDMGYIVNERVAGWLYVTNSNVAMIEGVISDPDTLSSARKHDLKRLCGTLIDMSMALGCTQILAITDHPGIEQLCDDFGFKEIEKKAFLLRDKDDSDYISDDPKNAD